MLCVERRLVHRFHLRSLVIGLSCYWFAEDVRFYARNCVWLRVNHSRLAWLWPSRSRLRTIHHRICWTWLRSRRSRLWSIQSRLRTIYPRLWITCSHHPRIYRTGRILRRAWLCHPRLHPSRLCHTRLCHTWLIAWIIQHRPSLQSPPLCLRLVSTHFPKHCLVFLPQFSRGLRPFQLQAKLLAKLWCGSFQGR